MKVAIMFSGQGSQYANMGLEFFLNNLEKVKEAEKILGFNILSALENNNDELNQTLYTQSLMTLMMMFIFDEINKKYQIDGLLGFSLGEYSALYASKVYSFTNILKIIKLRATLMDEAASKYGGKMVAVLTKDLDLLEEVIKTVKGNDILNIANYNAKNQYVVSGSNEAVNNLVLRLKSLNIKTMPLNVSGAFHSAFLNEASLKLFDYLKDIEKNDFKIPVYSNVKAEVIKIDNLEELMKEQIKSPVLFYQSIEKMILDGYTHFIEVGPKKVLYNLVKRNYQVEVFSVEKLSDIVNLEEFL